MPPEGIDSLDADSLKRLVLSLLAKIDDLVEQNKALAARIAELECVSACMCGCPRRCKEFFGPREL